MTILAPPALAANLPLTTEHRETGLTYLAKAAEWITYTDVTAELDRLAHPSLSLPRRVYLFESLRELTEQVAALRAGVADWTEFFDEGDFRNSCDAHVVAAELLEDRAREFLFMLINGEQVR